MRHLVTVLLASASVAVTIAATNVIVLSAGIPMVDQALAGATDWSGCVMSTKW